MSKEKLWIEDDNSPEHQKHAPATLRNRDAIVAVLKSILPAQGRVLEIASGTGEHVVYFGEQFPHLQFQPSDPDPECCRSIAAWSKRAEAQNVLPPLQLDALSSDWGITKPDAILCINMVHISPWEASIGLFEKAAKLLKPGAPLFLYGPYLRAEVETSDGNREFERSLKSRDLRWGLRDVADMDALAGKNGFARGNLVEMPANNISLIYTRE